MLALLLLLLAGTVYGSIHAQYHREALARMPLHVMAVRATVTDVRERRMTLQDATTCSNAWDAVLDWGNTSPCYAWLDSLWDLDASVDDVIEDFCAPNPAANNKTCSEQIYDLLVTLVQECEGTEDYPYVKEAVRTIIFATKIPCIRDEYDPSVLCFKEFRYLGSYEFTSIEIGEGNETNTTALGQLCNNCTFKILEQISLYAPDQFWEFGAYVKIMCTQYSGESCSSRFMQLTETAQDDIDLTDDHISNICDPCVQTMMYRFSQLSAGQDSTTEDFAMSVSFLGSYSIFCQQDTSGDYCLPKLLSFLNERNETYNSATTNATSVCNAVMNGTELCPGTPCQTFWQDLVAELGCCAGAWFDFLQFQYAVVPELYEYQQSPTDIKALIYSGCGVTVPTACSPSQLLLDMTINNIDAAWVSSNEDDFLTLLRDAVVYALAIDPTNLDVQLGGGSTGRRLLANKDGSVDISVHISTKDGRQTSQVQGNAENLDMTVLYTGLPNQALVDPTQPVSVPKSTLTLLGSSSSSSSSTSSTSSTTTKSSSGGKENSAKALVAPSALITLLIALAFTSF